MPALGGGPARRPLALASRRHRPGIRMSSPAAFLGCSDRQGLNVAPAHLNSKTNMSAKALKCSFPRIFGGSTGSRQPTRAAPHAKAIEYGSALNSEPGLVSGVMGVPPIGRTWLYQSQGATVRRSIRSGPIERARWEKRKSMLGTAGSSSSALAREFRWWNKGPTK